jgi:hypothetical protein
MPINALVAFVKKSSRLGLILLKISQILSATGFEKCEF